MTFEVWLGSEDRHIVAVVDEDGLSEKRQGLGEQARGPVPL